MKYWLFKSEPTTFSIDDLASRPNQTEPWDGIRNYQARNMLRDDVKLGDQVFFYHSSCAEPGIVGIAEVVKTAYPDMTAMNPESPYYDPRSQPDKPMWYCVDVKLVRKFSHLISLAELKRHPELEAMIILRKGNRLSITPVTASEWKVIVGLGKRG